MEELRNVSVWDFDHIVLKSSAKEGVWEAETLFRLYKLFERYFRRSLLFKGDERAELESFVRTIQETQASSPVGEKAPEGSRLGSFVILSYFRIKRSTNC